MIERRLQQAKRLIKRGDFVPAARIYQDILAKYPKNQAAQQGLQQLQQHQRNIELPRERIEEVIALYHRGQLRAALPLAENLAKAYPDHAVPHNILGGLQAQLKQLQQAANSFRRAIELQPNFVDAHNNLGNALREQEQFDAALNSYQQAAALQPDNALYHSNIGATLESLKRHQEALDCQKHALTLMPDFAEAYYQAGMSSESLDEQEQALRYYQQALTINPKYHQAHNNIGNVYKHLGQHDTALAHYLKASECQPDYPQARYNQGFEYLLQGDFIRGWQNYEYRWEAHNVPQRGFPQPQWRGEDLTGKTILLHCEQGIGDTLQFCRYVRLVAELPNRGVVFEVPKKLYQLLAPFQTYARLVVHGAPLPAFDYHCTLMSLPLAFATTVDTIPNAAGYLQADAALTATWEQRLGPRRQPRIGIAWHGNPKQYNDRYRSMSLATMLDGLPPNYEYISLHHEAPPEDQPALAQIRHFGDDLSGFDTTAGLYQNMDLIISVDTSLAHLGGALGKPTWVLLPFSPDFRWILGRPDSPWYSSMRLFRQTAPRTGDWDAVLAEVREALGSDFRF